MEKGTCPVCSGTTRTPYQGKESWKSVIAGYDADSDTLPCNNCGGQYMFGRPTGQVNVDFGGQPCVHEYAGANVGRCLTEYACKFCGDRYQIDSGD